MVHEHGEHVIVGSSRAKGRRQRPKPGDVVDQRAAFGSNAAVVKFGFRRVEVPDNDIRVERCGRNVFEDCGLNEVQVAVEGAGDVLEVLHLQGKGEGASERWVITVEHLVHLPGPIIVEFDAGPDLIGDLEARGQAGLQRKGREDPLSEAVEGLKGGSVQVIQGKPAVALDIRPSERVRAPFVQLLADAVLQLRRSGLGEGDGRDLPHRHPGLDKFHDPADQRGRLSSARARFDEERGTQVGEDRVPCGVVGGSGLRGVSQRHRAPLRSPGTGIRRPLADPACAATRAADLSGRSGRKGRTCN